MKAIRAVNFLTDDGSLDADWIKFNPDPPKKAKGARALLGDGKVNFTPTVHLA